MSHLPSEDGGPGWKPHLIRQDDGQGGWVLKPAECQILRYREQGTNLGYGLAQMDNGEVVLLGSCNSGKSLWYGGGEGEKTIIAFSQDRGETWSELEPVPLLSPLDDIGGGRPMMLAYLGGGNLTFKTGWFEGTRHFSSDYGRTWSEHVPDQPALNGGGWGTEGNPLVDRDEHGMVTRIAEIAFNFGGLEVGYVMQEPSHAFLRWSYDGGRTWRDESNPQAWYHEDTCQGKTYTRGISEGSLVRAANGWLVAALRTDVPARYFEHPYCDQMEGVGISISEDDGKTWSPVNENILYDAGRMHAHLLRMPNGDLVMTVTVRQDIQDGKLASYRRGCEAIISHDNGLTWDLERKYILDEWQFLDRDVPHLGSCGHLYSALLDDGSILTAHNNYLSKGITLIRWRP